MSGLPRIASLIIGNLKHSFVEEVVKRYDVVHRNSPRISLVGQEELGHGHVKVGDRVGPSFQSSRTTGGDTIPGGQGEILRSSSELGLQPFERRILDADSQYRQLHLLGGRD